MSQLKARCIDQVITFENTPVITSGDVNYDSIMFDFCSAWDGFTKTAIFYRSEDEVYYQLLDKANTCIIPNEVLTDKGDIFIGVFGVSGDTTITSQVLKYKITKGAITENLKPANPTPDIYAQLISGYNYYDERLAYFEERFNGSVGDAEKLGGQLPSYYAPLSELAKYLPLTGGTITGNVTQYKNTAESIIHYLANTLRTIYQEITANGTYFLYDKTNSKAIIRSDLDGTNTFNGTASGNLPLTGGEIGYSSQALQYNLGLRNSLRRVQFQVREDGKMRLYDVTNNKNIFSSDLDGTNTFNGKASGNLPLDGGGTVKKEGDTAIIVENTKADSLSSYIGYKTANGTTGYMGFYNGKPYVSGMGEILHTGNMASHVLPKSGGHITGTAHTPLIVDTTYSDTDLVRIGFYKNNTARGYLGIMDGKPTFTNASYGHYEIHHAGNSAKVHVGTDTPDTSSVWIDTSE